MSRYVIHETHDESHAEFGHHENFGLAGPALARARQMSLESDGEYDVIDRGEDGNAGVVIASFREGKETA